MSNQVKYYPELKKSLGFGCMRLPMKGDKVDKEEFTRMVDCFIDSGFNYFDTAHGYLDGQSETAIHDCLTTRHRRTDYVLTDKLTVHYFNSPEDVRPFIESQLATCGVDYFDFYLMHALNADTYVKYKRCRAFETAAQLKREGKIHHVGISFHDTADVLELILSEQPAIEVVQLQFNYVDYDDVAVQSRLNYETCVRHGKKVIVMEPVKGGNLVRNLPVDAQRIFDGLHGGSYASYAIRFAASFDNVVMTLSGMSDLRQMQDNISFMRDFKPLTATEREAIDRVRAIFNSLGLIPCTACRYCIDGCPQHIPIPSLFACLNAKRVFKDRGSNLYYYIHTKDGGKASECLKCGKCEQSCPQHLPIRNLLEDVAKTFEE
jgi:predicted aldo/keto reductase-like oxidoreductase